MSEKDNIKKERLYFNLAFGDVEARSDEKLEETFIETAIFYDIISKHTNIVRGRYGVGKSAIFLHLKQNSHKYIGLSTGLCLFLSDDPVPKKYFDPTIIEHLQDYKDYCCAFWMAYMAIGGSNKILQDVKNTTDVRVKQLLQELRMAIGGENSLFMKTKDLMSSVLTWIRTAKITFKYENNGIPITITLSGGNQSSISPQEINGTDPKNIDLDRVLTIENEILHLIDKRLWLFVDRTEDFIPEMSFIPTITKSLFAAKETTQILEQQFHGEYGRMIQYVLGLLAAVRRVSEYSKLTFKVFMKPEILELGDPHDLEKILAKSSEIKWVDNEIRLFMAKRIFSNPPIQQLIGMNYANLNVENMSQIFDVFFPKTIKSGTKIVPFLDWFHNYFSDGLGYISPRDIVLFLRKACHKQESLTQGQKTILQKETNTVLSEDAVKYGAFEVTRNLNRKFLKPLNRTFVGLSLLIRTLQVQGKYQFTYGEASEILEQQFGNMGAAAKVRTSECLDVLLEIGYVRMSPTSNGLGKYEIVPLFRLSNLEVF